MTDLLIMTYELKTYAHTAHSATTFFYLATMHESLVEEAAAAS